MMVALYLLLFAIATGATLFVIIAGTAGRVGSVGVEARTAIVISGFAAVLWGYLAVKSFEITKYSGGSEFTVSYPGLAWLAVAGGAVAFYVLFQSTVYEVQETGGL